MKASLADQLMGRPDARLIIDEVDRMLQAEQRLRRHFYETVSEEEKAEFINGEIIIHSPVKKKHDEVSGHLYSLLKTFVIKHQLGYVGHEKVMVSLSRNDYEPDICYFGPEKARHFDDAQTIFPAPDLVIEILSPGTRDRDYGIKLKDYEAHLIPEYWIVDTENRTLELRLLDNDRYRLQQTFRIEDHLQSATLAGFDLPMRAIFEENAYLEALGRILNP